MNEYPLFRLEEYDKDGAPIRKPDFVIGTLYSILGACSAISETTLRQNIKYAEEWNKSVKFISKCSGPFGTRKKRYYTVTPLNTNDPDKFFLFVEGYDNKTLQNYIKQGFLERKERKKKNST